MKKSYNLFIKYFLLIIAVAFSFNEAKASHIMGSDLSFRCIGPNQYRIRLSLYRDCSGISLGATQTVRVASASCGSTINVTLTRLAGWPIEVSPICASRISSSTCRGGTIPGVEEHIYEGTVTLPSRCTDWVFSWTTCCRNPAITTISTPDAIGTYIQATMNNVLVPCDNSPDFTTLPVPYVCNNMPYIYNHGAVDADGDSLYYTIVSCLDGGPTDPVPYIPPRTALSPLATSSGVAIDPANGNVSFTPNALQVAVMAILVQEFRDGVLIGSTMRDIQVTVLACTNNPPILDSISNAVGGNRLTPYRYEVCIGDSIRFDVYGRDSNRTDTLIMTNNVATAIPGAIFTNPIADTPSVYGTFSWVPTDLDAGINSFVVLLRDNACPVYGSTVRAYDIVVVGVAILAPDSQFICYPPGDTFTLLARGSATTYRWSVLRGDSASLTCTTCNPLVVFPTRTTTYIVEGTSPSGCQNSDTTTVVIIPAFDINENNDTTICMGQSVRLSATPTIPGSYLYSWSPRTGLSDSTSSNPIATPTVNTTYVVHVIGGGIGGCDDWDTVRVNVVNGGLFTKNVMICRGASYTYGGRTYTSAGIYRDTFGTSLAGCDSIFQLTVSYDTSVTFLRRQADTSICVGRPVLINNIIRYDTIVKMDTTPICDSYFVASIPFAPIVGGTPLNLLTTGDDVVSVATAIGFSFNFYCTNFTQFYASSNGFVTFTGGSGSGCCTGQLLPNVTAPNNLIACGWNDYNVTGGATVQYFLSGVAPNRILTVRYNSLPHFTAGDGTPLTTQVQLYETSNMIEIHTTALTANALGGNGHTFGIENIPGTRAKPVPGRNQAEGFTMTNESWRFTKGYTLLARKNPLTISWSPTTALVPTNRVNPTATPTSTTTYILSVFDSLCYFYDTVTITIRNKDTVNQTFSLCGGSIVRVGTRSYTTSGFYRDTLLNSAGCDSFVNTTLVIIPSDSLNQIISICDDSSFTYNGRTHTISGIYSDTFINRNGCDSIMYTYLNIRPRSFVTQNIRFCIGNSINVGVNTYSTSGTYRDTLTNILSCDSIITTNLIVDTFPVGRQTIHICPSSSYTVGSNTYTSAGVYTDTLLNPGRCDTIVITNLIIDTLPFSYQTIAICPDASYTIGSRTYSVPGSYNDTFPKPGFCDTIIVTTIIYKPISSSTITPSFCDGDTLRVGTSRYTTSGTRYDTLVNYVGCDSIVTSILTVYPNVVTIIPVTICYDQFYFAAGANRNTTNTYYDSLLSINGCDSVIRTNLTVIPLVTTTRTISICFGDSLFVQGANRGSSGTYYDTLVAISGCDSLLITNLIFKSHSYTTQNPRICNGASFTVGINTYTSGGTYQDTLVNYLGCDSVITTNLTIDTVILNKTTRNIRCFSGNDGQIVGSALGGVGPYEFNIGGAWQASGTFNSLVAGTYTLTVRDFNGCTANTSITLTQPLRILPIIAVNTAPLCNGGSDGSVQVGTTNGTVPFQYSLNNISYQVSNTLSGLSAGNYRAYVQDSLGCIDSINFTITEPAPIVIDVVTTQNKCNNDATGVITLSPRGGRTPYDYSIDGGTSFVGTNTFAGLVAGVYNIVVRDRNNCTASATTTLNNPTLFTIDASGVDVLCWDSDNGKINILPNGGTTPYQSYGISQNNVVFSTSNVPKFANLTSGFYYVEGYDANGCRATDTASIGRPPVDTFAFDIDSTSCYGAQYLDGSIIVSALANPPYTWTIDGGASQNFGIFYGLGAGYHLIIATNANGCVDSLIQFVPFPPPVIVDVVPDTVYLELGASQQINVNVQNAINPTYVWNTLQGLSCNDCPNPIVSPFNDMIYTIRVYDHSHPLNSSECYGEATLYVMVEEHIKSYVPNAFTPANTDGINDQLMVYGEGIKKLHFTIYDRWGELLFESNRQDIGWDGSYKGKILGPGVYIYYVEAEYLDSKKEYYQGSVTLLK